MKDYFVFYSESNIVCFIIFAIMLVHDLMSVDRQEKQIKYDQSLIAFMLYFVSDILSAGVIAGYIPRTLFSVVATNFANYIFMAMLTYRWLIFVMAVEQSPHRNRKINRFAVVFPFLVSTVVLIIVYCVSPGILLSEDLEVMPVFYVFLIAVPIIYICAVLVYALRIAIREENPIEKKKHIYIGLFPLMLIAGGLFQIIVLPKTPIFCFCCALLMLTLYIQFMDTQISMDPLTGLNNRGQLMRYISQKSNIHKEDRPTFVIMIDINDFKRVNDTYGHAEGDRALTIIADSLRTVVKKHNMPVFLGRYGGDEFIIIVQPADKEELASLIKEVRSQIESECRQNNTPYILSIGAGYDEYLNTEEPFQRCIQRADENLYIDKEYCKSHGQTTVCA